MPGIFTPSPAPPMIDPSKLTLPDRFGKSAWETKTDWFHGAMSDLLSQGTGYANYLTGEETNRYNTATGTLAAGRAMFDKPSMTDQDIARMFSGASDKAAAQYRGNIGNMRASLGASGVGPNSGYAQAGASRYQAQRQASLTDATRSLYEKRVYMDVQDRMQKWMADQALAAQQGKDPSIVGLDWLGQAASTLGSLYGTDAALRGGKIAAQASKDAGMMNLAGGAFSGLIGALA